jgi:hypothetical protein
MEQTMNFEDLQKAWQRQDAGAKLTLDADLLLKEVRRNQQQFRATIFLRDVREVGVCILMAVFFLVWGIRRQWWSLYLLSFCCFFVGAFFLVDRRLQRGKQPVTNDPLQACVQNSLLQVNHQIWLLKNVFWWYLLPIIIGLGAFTAQTLAQWPGRRLSDMLEMGAISVLTYGFTYGFVYWLNQRAVRVQLAPRRQELEALLASLNEKSTVNSAAQSR